MTRACYFFMWIFLAGTVLFAILTACCDCMSPGRADQQHAGGKAGKGSTPTPASEQAEESWHSDVKPSHAPERQPEFTREAPASSDPNLPEWYQDALHDRDATRANTAI